jgi:hypothetical protein
MGSVITDGHLFPAGHFAHDPYPCCVLYESAGQAVQVPSPSNEYVPAGHIYLVDVVGHSYPAGQSRHVRSPNREY